jgi:type II secretory pathway pseudopilin PulG
MGLSQPKNRGMTFVEVMTAIACLALVSASLVGGLAFAAERTELARQRSLVAEEAKRRLEALKAAKSASPNLSEQATVVDLVTGMSHQVTFSHSVSNDATKTGLVNLSLTANWTSRAGERTIPHELRLSTKVYVSPPTPLTDCLIKVDGKSSTFQHSGPPLPTIIDLSAYGLLPGMTITLQTSGSYSTGSGTSSSLTGVFASQDLVLSPPVLSHRIPFAIDAGTDVSTSASSSLGQDYPEDFLIGGGLMTIAVPAGARFLLVGVLDDPADNSGSIQLEVKKQ